MCIESVISLETMVFTGRRRARINWACRRGMLELDVLLMPFAEKVFDELSEPQQLVFERLLTSDDPDLYAWFMGHQVCEDPELADMVSIIVNRVKV